MAIPETAAFLQADLTKDPTQALPTAANDPKTTEGVSRFTIIHRVKTSHPDSASGVLRHAGGQIGEYRPGDP